MKKALLILLTICVTHIATAQTEKQKEFVDSCNKAISYYQDFLTKLAKGQNSFLKGKNLSLKSYKLLIELKSNNDVRVDDEQYELLKKSLENLKAKDFKTFVSTEQKLKDKWAITIKDKTVKLSADHGAPFAVFLEILKSKLGEFK